MRVLGLVIFFVNGFFFSFLFGRKRLSWLERIGVGFWLYSALFTFLFFGLNLYMGWTYTLAHGWMLHGVLGVIGGGVFFLATRGENSLLHGQRVAFWKNWTIGHVVVLGVLLVSWGLPLVKGLLYPIPGWDSLAVYDFYGKVFAHEGNMLSTLQYDYFGMYPFYIHLSHMWLYLCGFSTPLVWHALLYITFVWVAIGWVSRLTEDRSWVWVTALVVTGLGGLYHHSTLGYNNLDISGFLALAFLYGFEWVRTREYPYLFLSSLLGGGALWCRAGEPWWISLVLLYGVFLVEMKGVRIGKKLLWMAVALMALLTTKIVWEHSLTNWRSLLQRQMVAQVSGVDGHGVPGGETQNAGGEVTPAGTRADPERLSFLLLVGEVFQRIAAPLQYFSLERLCVYLPLTVDMFWRAIVFPRLAYWTIAILVMILFVIEASLRRRKELWVWPLVFWVNVGMIFGGTYIFIQTFRDWNIPGSAERMSLFLEPLVVFWALTVCLSLGREVATMVSRIRRVNKKKS